MNTTEVIYSGEIKDFKTLYSLAKKQFLEYEKIEGISNWEEYDFSLDCPEDQMKLKDMLQIRCIEEITEASVAIDEGEEHFLEEIGDVINFFLSAYIMMGYDLNKLPSPGGLLCVSSGFKNVPTLNSYSIWGYKVIESIGKLCNLLKNRPWSESNYMVSIVDYNKRAMNLWFDFWTFISFLGLTSKDLFEIFWKKYIVNIHRRETHY